jgi:hypothetical protein
MIRIYRTILIPFIPVAIVMIALGFLSLYILLEVYYGWDSFSNIRLENDRK